MTVIEIIPIILISIIITIAFIMILILLHTTRNKPVEFGMTERLNDKKQK